jgi:tetratricopeptide (TPR) repeat protein
MTLHLYLRRATMLAAVLLCVPLAAQPPRNVRQQQQMQQRMQEQMRAIAENQPELPSDPQLLSLHKEFVAKAERLAQEYERKKQYDKAREVYESLVRLVPKYSKAEEGLNRILSNQSMQDKKLTDVLATQLWQDSGVTLLEGMPVHIEVKGTWKVVYETGPAGIDIPEKMRPRDSRIKLGTLIAVIVNSPSELAEEKPFVLVDGKDFVAKKTGRLYMRMFDVDPSDNEGKLYVRIHSTFQK